MRYLVICQPIRCICSLLLINSPYSEQQQMPSFTAVSSVNTSLTCIASSFTDNTPLIVIILWDTGCTSMSWACHSGWSVPLMYSHPSSPPSATRRYNPAVSRFLQTSSSDCSSQENVIEPRRPQLFQSHFEPPFSIKKSLNASSWSSSSITQIRTGFSQSESQLTDDSIPPSQQCWSYTTTLYALLMTITSLH